MVTNDIYTTEDADFLRRHAVLPDDRIRAVQTGCCPHTAIRDDISANLDAIEDLEAGIGPLDLVLVESGGDNLTATFSRGLVDRQIFVVDVAGGDKVPRKGGPGVTAADLLVINKTDLAPLVGADLGVMGRDAAAVRGDRPTVLISLTEDPSASAGAVLGAGTTAGGASGLMHSEVLIVAAAGRLPRIECRGGLAARATLPDTVHLVSAAATPLGGDTISVRVVVPAGARLRLCSVAATVALPGPVTRTLAPTTPSRWRVAWMSISSRRWWRRTARQSAVLAAVDEAGELRLRERVQIGRTGEGQGFWSGALRVDVKGQPLLRHRLELGAGSPATTCWRAPRACVSELRYPGDVAADAGSTVLELAGGGVLTTWQGDARLVAAASWRALLRPPPSPRSPRVARSGCARRPAAR